MLLRENTFGTLRKEEKMWERAEIRAIFCKNVQKVLDGWTYRVVSSYLPVKEGFLFARFCFSARKKKRPLNLKAGRQSPVPHLLGKRS